MNHSNHIAGENGDGTTMASGQPIRTVKWTVDPAGSGATMSLVTVSGVDIWFNANALDEHLTDTGKVRAQIEPAVEQEFILGQIVAAVENPVWKIEPEAHTGNALLHLRDPRYGWLHFTFHRDEARRMAAFLQRIAEAVPEE